MSLFGINLKTVTANEIENRKVIPLGNIIGLKLYTKGVLVVGTNEIEGEDKKIYKPYEEAGIEQGDSIIKINDEEIDSTKKLLECIGKCKNKKIDVTYLKKGNKIKKTITPVKTGKNTYKLGLWVRDGSAGIGTLRMFTTLSNIIAAVGASLCLPFQIDGLRRNKYKLPKSPNSIRLGTLNFGNIDKLIKFRSI